MRTTFVHISREYILLRCFRKLCTVILFGKLPRKIFFFGYIKLNYICDVRFWQGIENEQKKLSSCEPIDYVEVIFDKYTRNTKLTFIYCQVNKIMYTFKTLSNDKRML